MSYNLDVDYSLLCESKIGNTQLIEDEGYCFERIMNMWRTKIHCINRRLASADFGDVKQILAQFEGMKDVDESFDVQHLIPRSDIYSNQVYQFSKIGNNDGCCHECYFETFNFDSTLRNPHIDIPYIMRLKKLSGDDEHQEDSFKLQMFLRNEDITKGEWLVSTAFPRIDKWFFNMDFTKDNSSFPPSLINNEQYALRYRNIKATIGKEIVSKWTEKTDPQKFVYEDCGIATYLLQYWDSHDIKPYFADVGCGNGLLTYILALQQVNGCGIDLRARNIWSEFKDKCCLVEKALVPSSENVATIGLPDICNFLIGNHSDELTPWIIVMAARKRCSFFILPCCPFDFYGKFTKIPATVNKEDVWCGSQGNSIYHNYLSYLKGLITKLGFKVEVDRLKIPSTKRICLIGTIPESGLIHNLDQVIDSILKDSEKNLKNVFVPREKVEQMRNCTNISLDIRNDITERIFKKLLQQNEMSVYCGGTWHTGGSMSVLEAFKLLNEEEVKLMKNQNGGFKTFLKNQHQVFKIHSGKVFIKNWAQEIVRIDATKLNVKKTNCWFVANHPDGCPLSSQKCLFIH
uniref:tRNA (uracil-O(2)-)-methyltransferase n=1 Tax=Rhabditophanes sp. KR3021 TaxID=114890 RepID=A0AC35TME0_9BILA